MYKKTIAVEKKTIFVDWQPHFANPNETTKKNIDINKKSIHCPHSITTHQIPLSIVIDFKHELYERSQHNLYKLGINSIMLIGGLFFTNI